MTSIAALGILTASCAEAGPTTTMSKSEIEALVKDYILENPEIIRDAFIAKTSRPAARAALAAQRQGKYAEMHFALMEQPRLSGEIIRATAEKIGLDMGKYDADLADPTIEQHIGDTLELADRLPALTGTPFFVIGEDYISGADTARLEQLVKDKLEL